MASSFAVSADLPRCFRGAKAGWEPQLGTFQTQLWLLLGLVPAGEEELVPPPAGEEELQVQGTSRESGLLFAPLAVRLSEGPPLQPTEGVYLGVLPVVGRGCGHHVMFSVLETQTPLLLTLSPSFPLAAACLISKVSIMLRGEDGLQTHSWSSTCRFWTRAT